MMMIIIIIIIIIIIMDTGVGQAGALAYFGNMDVPAHHSLGWCLWQASVTPKPPLLELQQTGSWGSLDLVASPTRRRPL